MLGLKKNYDYLTKSMLYDLQNFIIDSAVLIGCANHLWKLGQTNHGNVRQNGHLCYLPPAQQNIHIHDTVSAFHRIIRVISLLPSIIYLGINN